MEKSPSKRSRRRPRLSESKPLCILHEAIQRKEGLIYVSYRQHKLDASFTSESCIPGKYSSKLRSRGPARPWAINCQCPLDTEDGGRSIECEECKTWQHVYCYYERHMHPHFCLDCTNSLGGTSETEFANVHSSDDPIHLQRLSLEDGGSASNRVSNF